VCTSLNLRFVVQVHDAPKFEAAFYPTGGCNGMAQDADGDRTAHYAQLRLHGAPPGAPEPPPETVATAPGDVISSWHGTGDGERPGWSGAWLLRPPIFAHFVGGDVSGSKPALMQALGYWHFEAEEVVAHVRRAQAIDISDTAVAGVFPPQLLQDHCPPNNRSACWATWLLRPLSHSEEEPAGGGGGGGGALSSDGAALALSPSGSGGLSRLFLVELSGVGATPVLPTGAAFLEHDLTARARLAALGGLLRRAPVRPRAHCDSPWAVMHKNGFRSVWQTPGERWPFGGVGIAIGRCGAAADHSGEVSPEADEEEGGGANTGGDPALSGGAGSSRQHARRAPGQFCCTPIYGRLITRRQASCIGSVHAAVAERQALLSPPAVIRLAQLPRDANGALDAVRTLALLSEPRFANAPLLRIQLAAGEVLPPLSSLPADAAARTAALFEGACVAHAALANGSATPAELKASAAAFRGDLAEVGSRLASRKGGRRLGHVVKGREEFGLGEPSKDAWSHYRAWKDEAPLAAVY